MPTVQVATPAEKLDPLVPTEAIPESGNSSSAVPNQILDLIVIGSLASDTICDYCPLAGSASIIPAMKTSNPAIISQRVGGVGFNIARAAQLVGGKVSLCSMVANDIAGTALKEVVTKKYGMATDRIATLASHVAQTAQYVAIDDTKKDLVMAAADMSIFESSQAASEALWSEKLANTSTEWAVVDANWSPEALKTILRSLRTISSPPKIAFEPVSAEKSTRLFCGPLSPTDVFPRHLMDLTTPNAIELRTMHSSARDKEFLATSEWWDVVNRFNLPQSGSRDAFVRMLGNDLVDQGIPQQVIQLLPFVPAILTTLGSRGCLLAQILPAQDARLSDMSSTPYILSRSELSSSSIGGIYMRLFPAEKVPQEDIVSVNGVGDTLLGVLLASLARNKGHIEDYLTLAQKAAVLTLKSKEGISPRIKDME